MKAIIFRLFIGLAGFWLVVTNPVLAVSLPDQQQVRQEEEKLTEDLKPLLQKTLGKKFLGLSVHVRYIMQSDPISRGETDTRQIKLPGFDSYIRASQDRKTLAGYINKLERYRLLLILVDDGIVPSARRLLEYKLRQSGQLELGGKDALRYHALHMDSPLKNWTEDLDQKDEESGLNEDEKGPLAEAKKKKNRRKGPPVDPKKEAKSSLHLLNARQAYFHNDLNKALSEVIEAINITPNSPQNYEMLGSIYYRLNWKSLAYKNWQKSLELDPENKKLADYVARLNMEP